MFEAARLMVEASLPPELSAEERRRRVFERLYGDEGGGRKADKLKTEKLNGGVIYN
jgi:hypothetical protein